jgi:hypothetical protein
VRPRRWTCLTCRTANLRPSNVILSSAYSKSKCYLTRLRTTMQRSILQQADILSPRQPINHVANDDEQCSAPVNSHRFKIGSSLEEDCQGIRGRFGTVGKVSEVCGNGQTKRSCREFPWLWQNSLSSQGLRITVLPASFRLSVPSESLAIFARNAGVPICREVSWGRSSLLPRSLAFLASADCK